MSLIYLHAWAGAVFTIRVQGGDRVQEELKGKHLSYGSVIEVSSYNYYYWGEPDLSESHTSESTYFWSVRTSGLYVRIYVNMNIIMSLPPEAPDTCSHVKLRT